MLKSLRFGHRTSQDDKRPDLSYTQAHDERGPAMEVSKHEDALRGFSDRDERQMLAPRGVSHVEIDAGSWSSTDESMRSSTRRATRPTHTRFEPRGSASGPSMEVDPGRCS